MKPRDFTITYRPHLYDCVLAVYPAVHARNFRMPASDDLLKSRAIADATYRLKALFLKAATR